MEVYDTDKTFHITSSKIKINTGDCYLNVDEKLFKNALNIQEYLTRKEELLNAEFQKIASKMPKGYKAAKFDKNCEDCPKPLEIFDEKN